MPVTLQTRTLHLYGELLAHRPAWPGKLILTAGAGASATGILAAASIAGATALAIDPDAKAARAILREGGVDFIVNTLDEAVRVLKNEIRKRRPLGVALTADPAEVLAEFRDRGLLPDLSINTPDFPAKASLQLNETPSAQLTTWLAARNWIVGEIPRGVPLPAFPGDDPRSAWLRNIPRYQRSATREPRALWLTSGLLTPEPPEGTPPRL